MKEYWMKFWKLATDAGTSRAIKIMVTIIALVIAGGGALYKIFNDSPETDISLDGSMPDSKTLEITIYNDGDAHIRISPTIECSVSEAKSLNDLFFFKTNDERRIDAKSKSSRLTFKNSDPEDRDGKDYRCSFTYTKKTDEIYRIEFNTLIPDLGFSSDESVQMFSGN